MTLFTQRYKKLTPCCTITCMPPSSPVVCMSANIHQLLTEEQWHWSVSHKIGIETVSLQKLLLWHSPFPFCIAAPRATTRRFSVQQPHLALQQQQLFEVYTFFTSSQRFSGDCEWGLNPNRVLLVFNLNQAVCSKQNDLQTAFCCCHSWKLVAICKSGISSANTVETGASNHLTQKTPWL